MMVGMNVSAQEYKVNKVDLSFYGVHLKQVDKVVDGDVISTSSYIYFKNSKYKHISDLKFIWLRSQESVDKIASDLEKMLAVPDGAEARLGHFNTYDFAPGRMYINAEGGYASINKKKAREFLEALKEFKVE